MYVVPLTGFRFPFGSATGGPGDSLASRTHFQWVPLEVGLGAKVLSELYIGGYFGAAVGAEGNDARVEQQCDDSDANFENDVACSTSSVRLGLEARYVFTPADETTFWAGYGLGLTTLTETIRDDGGYSESVTLRGLTLARVTGGLDWRLARGIGMGPTVGVEIGRYTATRTEIGGEEAFDGDVPSPAFHLWLDVGFRLVILP